MKFLFALLCAFSSPTFATPQTITDVHQRAIFVNDLIAYFGQQSAPSSQCELDDASGPYMDGLYHEFFLTQPANNGLRLSHQYSADMAEGNPFIFDATTGLLQMYQYREFNVYVEAQFDLNLQKLIRVTAYTAGSSGPVATDCALKP